MLPEAATLTPGEKLTEINLKAIVSGELENALGVDGGKLSISRRDSLKQYLGEPYGNEVDGRSQVVDRTILETVEWVLPALLRIFLAGDKVVEFEPTRPEEEQLAKLATEVCNYIFQRDNNGFLVLHTWFKDALLQKNGFLKVYWDTQRTVETEVYRGLTYIEKQAILQDPDVELIEDKSYPLFGPAEGAVNQNETREGGEDSPPVPLPDAPEGAEQACDITIRRTRNEGRVKIDPVPPEEILISRRATSIEKSPFVCHRVHRTISELIEMGYPKDVVEELTQFDEQEYNTERVQRFQKEDEWPYRSTRTDKPMVDVWVSECYIKVDWDNDGIAELRKVTVAGDKTYVLLGNDEVDEIPIVSITPVPMPHIFFGLSLADLVADLQLIRTVLWRQMLDNLYLANNPRHYVDENQLADETIDDLLTSRPGGIVRGKGPNAVTPLVTPFVAAEAFPMLEYIDKQASERTGVSKLNQAMNPDDLNKNTQVGSMGIGMLQEAAAQRVELFARIFAETGVKALFKHILGLLIRNGSDAKRMMKLTGGWVEIDPTSWKRNMDVTVSVGLGTGNKDRMIAHLMQLLGLQAQAVQMQGGPQGPLVFLKNLYETGKAITEAMGFKNTEKFFSDPAKAPPQPPKPDPKAQAEMAKVQVQAQAEQLRAQNQLQIAQMKQQTDAFLKQQQFQAEAALKKYQADLDAQVDLITKTHATATRVEMGGNQV